jgi:hypothetical protein
VPIRVEPFVGSWIALGAGIMLLLLGALEFRSVVLSSLNRMAAAPHQAAAEPAQAMRLTGLLGPAVLLILLLMNMADVFVNGGGAGSQPWSLLRTLQIGAFVVHLFHAVEGPCRTSASSGDKRGDKTGRKGLATTMA